MTILSQKGLFTAYLDIKLTVANTNADDVGRWQTPNWYITSNGHVNKCSRVTAVHFSFPLFLKTISPIQKCQLFKVDFHKHICVRFYHGSSESEKCSLAGFSSLKKIRKAIPKSNQRRVNEKQLHRQNPGDWILEQRGEKVQSMTGKGAEHDLFNEATFLSLYLQARLRAVGTHSMAIWALEGTNFTRVWPRRVWPRRVYKKNGEIM